MFFFFCNILTEIFKQKNKIRLSDHIKFSTRMKKTQIKKIYKNLTFQKCLTKLKSFKTK